jgi:hypothetical protein
MNFAEVFTYLQSLMTTHEATFVASGLALYKSLVVITWVWFGCLVALRGEGFPMDKFMDLVMKTAIGFAMLQFYSASLPAFGGRSFSRLIIDQGSYLANVLNDRMVDQISGRLAGLIAGLETPGIGAVLNGIDLLRWAFTSGAIVVAYFAMFAIISFGYIAGAIGILIGPIMIPFFIVPSMNHIFWGWIRAMFQYAFYPVIGNAYIFVMGSFLIAYVDRSGTDLSGINHVKTWVPLLALLMSFAYGLFKIPSLTNSFFTGKSGEFTQPW